MKREGYMGELQVPTKGHANARLLLAPRPVLTKREATLINILLCTIILATLWCVATVVYVQNLQLSTRHDRNLLSPATPDRKSAWMSRGAGRHQLPTSTHSPPASSGLTSCPSLSVP